MGKYVQTALHSALQNKLGTLVYYKHKKGISFRAVSVKAQTPSTDRTRVRGFLKTSAAAWNATLTQPQRAAWNTAAAAADFRMNRRPRGRLSGWQMFHRANLTLLNIGKPILAAPVQISAPDPVTSFSIDTLDATTQTIKLAIAGGSRVNTHLIIYATGNREIDQLADQRWTRQVAVIPPGWTSPVDISADWTTNFGTLNGSVRVAFAISTADDRDGQLSARQYTAGISTGSATMPGLWSQIMSATPTAALTLLSNLLGTSAATADTAVGQVISGPTAVAAYTTAVPATPYKITALLITSNHYCVTGLGWTDGTKLQFIYVAPGYLQPTVINFSNVSTYAGTPWAGPTNDGNFPTQWLQIEDDGTTVYFRYSNDGVTWNTAYSITKASGYLGPTGYSHIMATPSGNTNPGAITIASWALS